MKKILIAGWHALLVILSLLCLCAASYGLMHFIIWLGALMGFVIDITPLIIIFAIFIFLWIVILVAENS